MKIAKFIVLVAVFMASMLMAQTAGSQSVEEPVLGPGDLLEISVFEIPELSQTIRISGAGSVEFPLIGSVAVAGKTTSQAAQIIGDELRHRDFVKNPVVNILVKQFATQGVSVLGEVRKPGVYTIIGPRRLMDVVAEAGGLEPTASSEIQIQHRGTGEVQNLKLLNTSSDQNFKSNVMISPGDTILVSRASIVYVVGDVNKPGGFAMQDGGSLSTLQVIALAGGTNRTAAARSAKIIRRTETGYEEHPLDLNEILAGHRADVALQANDVVFVPNSLAKSTGKRTLEAIFQVATGMTIRSYTY